MNDFVRNLRYLTAERGTAAQLCREMGLNQQQFSKYLNGRSVPSAATHRKLARFFGVEDEDLLRPHGDLVSLERRRARAGSVAARDPFAEAFPGDLRSLRRYAGAYQTFYMSPAAPGRIVCAAAFLDERQGMVLSRNLEASRSGPEGRRQWIRCNGKAAYHGQRLFIIDYEHQNGGSFMMTTLFPPHRRRKKHLFGVTSFLASHPRRAPYTSRVVWKRFDDYRGVKELLSGCDFLPWDSRRVDPAIREYLSGKDDLPEHSAPGPGLFLGE